MSSKLFIVIRKEYLERVRTRAFALGTALGPILIALMMFGPHLLAERTGPEQQTILIVDPGEGTASAALEEMLQGAAAMQGDNFALDVSFERPGSGFDEEAWREDLDARVKSDELDGYVILAPNFMRTGRATYYGETLSGAIGMQALEGYLDQVVQEERMSKLGIGAADLADVLRGAQLERRTIGVDEQQDLQSRALVGIAMIMLLYMMMVLYGQFTMSAVIEDKSTRVVEVMLASVTPNQLMVGKVVGQGLVGFTQFVIWAVAGAVFSRFGGQVMGMDLDFGQIDAELWGWFGVFFVLGFLMYSALYAGVGALCSSMQDAQNYQFPITALIVLPMLMLTVAMQAPDSGAAMVLSLIPLFTPILMFIRIVVGDPDLWQVLLSVALLAGTVFLLLKVAGKLFRMSILHFGKAPSWAEVLRMLRAPD